MYKILTDSVRVLLGEPFPVVLSPEVGVDGYRLAVHVTITVRHVFLANVESKRRVRVNYSPNNLEDSYQTNLNQVVGMERLILLGQQFDFLL